MYLECVQDTHCHCTYLCCVQQRRCGVELEVDFVPFVGTGLVCKEQFHLAAEDSRLHAGLQLSIKWKHLCRWNEAIIIITVHTAHAHSVVLSASAREIRIKLLLYYWCCYLHTCQWSCNGPIARERSGGICRGVGDGQ